MIYDFGLEDLLQDCGIKVSRAKVVVFHATEIHFLKQKVGVNLSVIVVVTLGDFKVKRVNHTTFV